MQVADDYDFEPYEIMPDLVAMVRDDTGEWVVFKY